MFVYLCKSALGERFNRLLCAVWVGLCYFGSGIVGFFDACGVSAVFFGDFERCKCFHRGFCGFPVF